MPGQSGIHGFSSWVDFVKATVSLGSMIIVGVFIALTYALDGRYASADISLEVASNGVTARAVQGQLSDLKVLWLQEQIFEVREKQCMTDDRSFYARRLADLVRQYQEVEDNPPHIPDCRDL